MPHGFLKLCLAMLIVGVSGLVLLGLVNLAIGHPFGIDLLSLAPSAFLILVMWPHYRRGEEESKTSLTPNEVI